MHSLFRSSCLAGHLFVSVAAMLACLFARTPASGQTNQPCITDVLTSWTSSTVRIAVQLDKAAKYSYRETTSPPGLTLEIPDATSKAAASPVPINRGPVSQVTVIPAHVGNPARVIVLFSDKASWTISDSLEGRRITMEIRPYGSTGTQSAPEQPAETPVAPQTPDKADPKPAVVSEKPRGAPSTDTIECSFKDTDLHDVIQMVARLVDVNIIADSTIQGKITLNLTNIGWEEGLRTALRSLGYGLIRDGSVYIVTKTAPPNAPVVMVESDRLSVSANQADIKELLAAISEKSGLNIVTSQAVDGKSSVQLSGVPIEDGIYTFLTANGYSFRKTQDIYVVDKLEPGKSKPALRPYKRTTSGNITIDFKETELTEVLAELSNQTGKNVVSYGQLAEKITIRLVDVTLEEALKLVLAGSKYSFRQIGEVFVVGDATNLASPVAQMLTVTSIIPLKYIKAEECPKYLSGVVPAANVKPIKEQNSLLVVGTEDMIARIAQEIGIIDQPSPQVMIEAQVLDVSNVISKSIGLDFQGAYGAASAKLPGTGQIVYKYAAANAKSLIVTLQALVNDGKARVLANPRVCTINGKEANITISQQRYFRTGYIPPYYQNPGDQNNTQPQPYYGYNPYGQVQSVEAGIILRIVPFVGASGDITVDIEPEVSNVTGTGPDGLPEVSRRRASTTVRVKDGETIIIGGLKQREQSKSTTRTPLLSSIPIIGELFKSRTSNTREADLVILITPTLIVSDAGVAAIEAKESSPEATDERSKAEDQAKSSGNEAAVDEKQ